MINPYYMRCICLSTTSWDAYHMSPVKWSTLRYPSISGERDSKWNSQHRPMCWKNGHPWLICPWLFQIFSILFGFHETQIRVETTWIKVECLMVMTQLGGINTPISACQERRDVQSGNFDVRLPKDFESGKSSWSLSFESENLMAERFDNILDNDQILSMYTRRHKMLFTYKNICDLKNLPDIRCGFRLVGSPAGVQRHGDLERFLPPSQWVLSRKA